MSKTIITMFKELVNRIQSDDLSAKASKLTYYILLSMFPLLITIIEILRRIEYTNPNMIFMITDFFPEQVSVFFKYIIEDISNVTAPTSLLSITALATLWAASRSIMAIISTINVAYGEEETRHFVVLRLISLAYTIAFLVILIITFTLIVLGQKIFNLLVMNFAFIGDLENIILYGRYLLSVISTFLFFIMLYNITPNIKISFIDATPGALFSTVLFMLLSSGFSFYVSKATSLSYMYGSLTSMIILLIWLYFTSMIILLGGEINAVIAHFKKPSTPRPIK